MRQLAAFLCGRGVLQVEVRRLGDVPVDRGGLQGLLYKCSKQRNETDGCRTLPGSLEAVYEMGAYLMSLDEASQKYQKMKQGPMGFVSAGGAKLPPLRSLCILAGHHSAPQFRELRMGGRGKKWQTWQGGSSDSAGGWQQRGASHSYQGTGRWHQEERRQQDHSREDHSQKFPSYETMKPKLKAENTQKNTAETDGETDLPAGEYTKGIQRMLNGFRKAEVRMRKIEEAKDETDAKWEEFQRSLREAFIKERAKHHEKVARLNQEMEEQSRLKEEALQELKAAIAEPKTIFRRRDEPDNADALEELAQLLASPPRRESGITALLEDALKVGGLENKEHRNKLLAAIDKQRRKEPPTTPTRRSSTYIAATPPSNMAAPARGARSDGNDGMDTKEPYIASPSLTGVMPSPLRSKSRSTARTPIKCVGRRPIKRRDKESACSKKLEEKRRAEMHSISDSEEDLVGGLGQPLPELKEENNVVALVGADGMPAATTMGSRTYYDLIDIQETVMEYLDDLLSHWGAALYRGAWGCIETLMAIQLCLLFLLLLGGTCPGGRVMRGPMGRLCACAVVITTAKATSEDPPRQPHRRPQQPTDLEIWTSGLRTLREQFAAAEAREALTRPLERSRGEAPPPDLRRPISEQAEEEPVRVVPWNAVHISMWASTPFFEAEVVDLEIGFPVTINRLKRALAESFTIVPDFADELTPTVPQVEGHFASFVAAPGWLSQAGRSVLVLDTRSLGGTVFTVHNEGMVSREKVLKHIEDYDLPDVDVFVFGGQLPLLTGFPVEPVHGGLIKVLPRGEVCEWSTELDLRLEDDELWDPHGEIPGPIEGTFNVYQSPGDQLVIEDDLEEPKSYMDTAHEWFDNVRYLKFPEEPPERLEMAGRHISQQIAVVDQDWPRGPDSPYIFVDARGLACFPQWVRVPGAIFDPVLYYEDLQVPEVNNWTLVIGGGEALGDNQVRVRDGEIIRMHMVPSSSMSTSEEEETESMSDTGSPSSDRAAEDEDSSGSRNNEPGQRLNGPPPPQPVDRSRSPRRDTERLQNREVATIELATADLREVCDLTASSISFPHDWLQVRWLYQTWSPEWLNWDLSNVQIPRAAREALKDTVHWSDLLTTRAHCDRPEVHIYTDGSADERRGTAGYGVVLLLKCGAMVALLGLLGEQVLGGGRSLWPVDDPVALRTEQIALAAAMLWLLQFRGLHPELKATVHYDCLAAGQAATGQWSASDAYGAKIRELEQIIQESSMYPLAMAHVKAHQGHGWNELADAVAKHASQGRGGLYGPPATTVTSFHNQDLSWIATELAARRTGALSIDRYSLQWRDYEANDYQLAPHQLIRTNGPRGAEDDRSSFEVAMATVNVQGIQNNYKFLEEQCDQLGLNIVFIQETKSGGGHCRSSLYARYATESNRHWGVAVWIHRVRGLLKVDDKPIIPDEADITIHHQDCRLLAMAVNVGSTKMALIAGHCPHQSLIEQRRDFLQLLDKVTVKLKDVQLLFCGLDLNGRVPAGYTGVTGDLECGEPDDAGWKFVETMYNIGAWIPSTYGGIHEGANETYHHPTGTSHRLDYIALGGRGDVRGANSEVCFDFDNGSPNVDHHLLRVQCHGQLEGATGARRLWRPRYDRDKMHTPEGKITLDRALQQFEQPKWDTPVDEHCQILQEFLVGMMTEKFPPPEARRRASFIPDKVWQLREIKNLFKRRVRHRRHLWREVVGRAFLQWAHDTSFGVEFLTHKEGFLYNLAAAAITVATRRMRDMIAKAKNASLQQVAGEGHQGVIQVLQRVKKAGFGGKRAQPVRRHLPVLMDPDTGQPTTCRSDRDNVWLKYFGDQEQGDIVTVDEFLRQEEKMCVDTSLHWEIGDLPTLSLIEETMRRTPKGKACGLDGIPSDLLAAAPVALAAAAQPLFVKSMLRGAQPTQWRGGLLFEAFKNAGTPADVEGYRSLFISSFIGKAYHKAVRTMIGPQIDGLLHPLHCGTRKRSPVAFPSMFVVTQMRRCQKLGYSSSALFVDTKSAYYRVVRDLATGCVESDAQVISLFSKFGLDAEDLHDMMETIRSGGMLAQADVNARLRHVIKDMYMKTWFITAYSGGGKLCHSRAGSRPGESFADVIYAFIYARILYRIHEQLEAEGLNFSLEWEEEAGIFPSAGGGTPQQAWDATWADDSAFVMEDRSPHGLLAKTSRTTSIVLGTLLAHGMQPNTKVGKTSLMLQLRGPGSTTARRQYFGNGKASLRLHDLGMDVPTVCQYRHLGSILDNRLTLQPEARYRLALAAQAYESAKPLLLNNRSLELATRAGLFEITVATTFFNLVIWHTAGKAWDTMRNGHARLVRRLLAHQIEGSLLFHLPLPLVMWMTGCIPLELLAFRQRMSFLVSMVASGPGLLWAALQEEKDWMCRVRDDLAWAIQGCERQWPRLHDASWPEWWHILKQSPARIKRLVKTKTAAEQERRVMAEAIDICLWAMSKDLEALRPKAADLPQERWGCRACRKCFGTKAQLSVHLFKRHKRVATYRFYAVGTRCRACGVECWSEGRLGVHLRSSTTCVRSLQAAGHRVDHVGHGIGSKGRRKADVDQYTLAAPMRMSGDLLPEGEEFWHDVVKTAYRKICEYFHAVDLGREPNEVSAELLKILTDYPLYADEEEDILMTVSREIQELQKDEDTREWSTLQAETALTALNQCQTSIRDTDWLPPSSSSTTLQDFKRCVSEVRWMELMAFTLSNGTRSKTHHELPPRWEAEWREELRVVDLSAVARNATCLLPRILKDAWSTVVAGGQVQLKAPQSFWDCELSRPFTAAMGAFAS
ncbi:unnamed protein product [Symbiodinium sp. CCMP2456]|nr:unnamed protein product [Symbiodinium sp. CCMP2456]